MYIRLIDKIKKLGLKDKLTLLAGLIYLGFIGFLGYGVYIFLVLFTCGLDDGPFEAELINPIEIPEVAEKIYIENYGILHVDNRTDSLSPVLTLVKKGKIVWSLEMDLARTKGFENSFLEKISQIRWSIDDDDFYMDFVANWDFGNERAWMTINLDDGDNCFCLSW